MRRKLVFSLMAFVILCIAQFVLWLPPNVAAQTAPLPGVMQRRPAPPRSAIEQARSESLGKNAAGYCPSYGGSTLYEKITSIDVTRGKGTMTITVNVYIANPDGCTAGNPCPSYDPSPEYVNVWIDWNGNKVWDAQEKVMDEAGTGYLNINYQGTMTFTKIVPIPPQAVFPTMLRANLGWGYDPDSPCETFWEWGNVVDQQIGENIQVVQMDVAGDFDIRSDTGALIVDPVWKKEFDAHGQLVDTTPVENDPVADSCNSGSFTITATLDAYPAKPAWEPRVEYAYDIVDSEGNSRAKGGGVRSGWICTFFVACPRMVDEYNMKLEFKFFDPQGNLVAVQNTSHRLFMTIGDPKLATPKVTWLEKATHWGRGARDADTALSNLNDGIYSQSGWTYTDVWPSWEDLVENKTTMGNCVSFSEVWNALAKVLGIDSTSTPNTRGHYNMGFITKSATALDGNKGNAHPQGAAVDRWLFGMHQVGRGAGGYYDPTFGKTYAGLTDFIEWHAISSFYVTEDGRYRQDFTDGHYAYLLSMAGWRDYEYHSPASPSNPAPSGDGEFTGSYQAVAADPNGDGQSESMIVRADLTINQPGTYAVVGEVYSGETPITNRSSKDSTMPTHFVISGTTGPVTARLEFSGEDIRQSRLDGPYTVKLYLLDSNGLVLARGNFATIGYRADQFGELPARIGSASDTGVDQDGNGSLDAIRVLIGIDATLPGQYALEGTLYAGETAVTVSSSRIELSRGDNTAVLDFDGREINAAGLAGPYAMELALYDSSLHLLENKTFTTNEYDPASFARKAVTITGPYVDYGTDSDGDGLYDLLTVEAGILINEPGTYTINGWLQKGGEEIVDLGHSQAEVTGSGQCTAILHFKGTDIHESQLNGPYRVVDLLAMRDDGAVIDSVDDAHLTRAYDYRSFDPPAPPLVALTGDFSDYGADADGDGYYDHLVVRVGAVVAAEGNAVAEGWLTSSDGTRICGATNYAHLQTGLPGHIELAFAGEDIFASGKDGPYKLVDLRIYHTGDPALSSVVEEAYTTESYGAGQFQPAAAVRGTVKKINGAPIGGAVVNIAGRWAYSDGNGRYFVGLPTGGEVTVGIDPPGGYPDGPWQVSVDGGPYTEGEPVSLSLSVGVPITVDFVHLNTPNEPPVAVAGPEQTIEASSASGALVYLDASQSHDPDGDPLTYTWTGPFGTVDGLAVQVTVPLGSYQITLTVSDGITASTATTTVNVVDTTPPLIAGGPITPPNSNGWYNRDVTVRFEAHDEVSGIAFVTPDVVISDEGADQCVTGTATDNAGNSATVVVSGISIDKTAPTIEISGVSDGGIYQDAVSPSIVVSDLNLDRQSITLNGEPYLSGTRIEAAGQYEMTVIAVDKAENTATTTIRFTIGTSGYALICNKLSLMGWGRIDRCFVNGPVFINGRSHLAYLGTTQKTIYRTPAAVIDELRTGQPVHPLPRPDWQALRKATRLYTPWHAGRCSVLKNARVVGNLRLSGRTKVTGLLVVEGNLTLYGTMDLEDVLIFCTGKVTIHGNIRIAGLVYAGRGLVTMGKTRLTGLILANGPVLAYGQFDCGMGSVDAAAWLRYNT